MKALLKKYNIDETFSTATKKQKVFNHIKNNIPQKEDYNYMADLLMMPKTKEGYIGMLVVVDMADNEFDIEQIKSKEPKEIKSAFEKMIKRKYIKMPYASIRTDNGTEFKGEFNDYLLSNGILHKFALPERHKQMAIVENLNKSLGRIFNGYMNMKEEETGKEYKEWTDIINDVRKDFNEIRKVKLQNTLPEFSLLDAGKPKYKVGDFVHEKLDHPENALGHKQPTAKFREGDYRFSRIAKKIVRVIYMNDYPYYRYILDTLPNVSYSENELMKSKETESKYVVKEIIGKKKIKNVLHYLVWWKHHLKKDATWEPAKNLIEDGLQDYIDEFNKNGK